MSTLSFPISDPSLLRDLESTHNLVRVPLPGQPALGYSLILPKGWITEEDLGEQNDGIGRLVRIGLFASHVGPDTTVVQVFYSRVPFEIDVRDWLEYEAAKFGTRLSYCQALDFAVGPVVDAGGLYGPPSSEQVVRLVAHADAARIFLVNAMTPRTSYPAQQRNFAIATNSFKLLLPSGSTQLEQWLDTTGGKPAFHVAYPATWTSRPVEKQVPGKSGTDLLLVKDEQLAAYTRVKAIDTVQAGEISSTDALQTAAEELQEAGIVLASSWQEDNDPSLRRVEGLAAAYLAAGQMGGNTVDLRFGLVKRGNLLFSVTLISVQKNENPILWMRSKRAYEIALATARPAGTATR